MISLVSLLLQAGLSAALTVDNFPRAAAPTVTLDSATVTGTSSGTVSKFLGIPFGQPPTGNLRFQVPQAVAPYTGTLNATAFGPSCIQQAVKLPILTGFAQEVVDDVVNSIFGIVLPGSEDCLTLNVIKPATATTTSKLPVVAWIFGGGFELGGTSMYDGTSIVERSITLGDPIIYVSMNYRVSAYGFLASQEVKDAGVGNLGIQDQRLALQWIQKYVTQFGGDPTKVTLWGESAGAISAALHMLVNDGNNEGLFRAAFMQSGSPIPVGDITDGQKYYDAIVSQTGCSSASDTLQCLREVDLATLEAAVNASPFIFDYQSLILAWLPRADGNLFSAPFMEMVQNGLVAKVPIVTGDCDDEGTLFSLSTLNITTDAELEQYIKTIMLPGISDSDLDNLMDLYPEDPIDGSPFNTGLLNAVTPQFKRIAAFQGDAVFQAPRRFFIQSLSGKQNIWTYVSTREKAIPILGSFHSSDLFLNSYLPGGDMQDYIIRFVATLNPNGNTNINWPQYTTASPNMLSFNDGLFAETLTTDTYRASAMSALTQVLLAQPI